MTENLIRREDYRPPQWSVREAWLSFALDEETTEQNRLVRQLTEGTQRTLMHV